MCIPLLSTVFDDCLQCDNMFMFFGLLLYSYYPTQKSAVTHLQRLCPGQKLERIFMDWSWWILAGLPFPHLVRVMDCFFHEGIKVFYRVALAILILYQKHASSSSSSGSSSSATGGAIELTNSDSLKNDIDNALPKFCRNIPVSPTKLLRTAFSIRALRYYMCEHTYTSYIYIHWTHPLCVSIEWSQFNSNMYVLYTFTVPRTYQECLSRLKWYWKVNRSLVVPSN